MTAQNTQISSKTIAVLGASGNVGKLLVEYLVSKGYKIKAFGRHAPKFDLKNVENLEVDYSNQEEMNKAVASSDITYMLVGLEYKSKVWEAEWVPLVKRLIDACESAKSKLVFFDNVYAYGLTPGKMTETSPLKAQTRKGKVRKEIQETLEEVHKSGKIKLVIAKCADFYGPGITTSVLGDRFLDFIVNKNTVELFGNPAKKHNYTYVADIPPALEVLGLSDFEGVIHLPTNTAHTGQEFKEILEKVTGKTLKLTGLRQTTAYFLSLFIPILRELFEMMYQSENDYDFDSNKILKEFPELKVTSYEVGFKETIEWYRKVQS